MSTDDFTRRVRVWIAEGATCSSCGHLLANHDCGWCYTCAKAETPCGNVLVPPTSEPVNDE